MARCANVAPAGVRSRMLAAGTKVEQGCCPRLRNRYAWAMWFGILFAIDAAVALVFLYFFLIGIADGSVSSFNIMLWLAILAGLAAILIGAPALRAHGQRPAANALLLVLAIPGFPGGLFVLALIVLQPRWN